MANIKDLEAFTYLSIVDRYAERYGKLPREINAERFDDVMPIVVMLRKEQLFAQRYREAEKKLNGYDNKN